jgi:predicted MFS family arabinose efflux permease
MSDRMTPFRAYAALATLSMSTFAFVTAETLPIGLLTPIAEGLRATPASVGLLVTGYGLVVVLTSVPLTRLTRRLPRRGLLLTLMAVFTIGAVGSSVAPTYGLMLASRSLTAVAQALFWSIVVAVGAGLVPEAVRGRAVALIFGGSSLAGVLGVPAATWLGGRAGWRASFVAIAVLGVLLTTLLAVLLPSEEARSHATDRGSEPDARRYRLLVLSTALTVTGALAAFTYIEPFMVQVTGLDGGGMSTVLLVRGVAGVAGVIAAGALVDRDPWLALFVAAVVQALALGAQYAGASSAVVAVAAAALSSAALTMFATALGTRVLQVAPGPTDVAAAGMSTAFNVGITAGAFAGSIVLTTTGTRSVALAGAAISVVAIVVQLVERGGGTARGRAPRTAAPVPSRRDDAQPAAR